MTWYEPEDGRRHQVGVEFEEFFDLLILDPGQVARVARIADKDDGDATAGGAPQSSPSRQPRSDG
jgi:hypothetical protein